MIRRIFLDNIWMKINALLLAILTWHVVNQFTSNEKNFRDVPLEILSQEGWSIKDLSIDTFEVAFRGSREDILALKPSQIKVQVDLREKEPGEVQVVNITPKDILYPGAARPYRIVPSVVTVRLDQIGSKLVPIKPNVMTGSLQEGYRLESVICKPAMVKIFGSQKRLEEVTSIQTAPIDLSSWINSFSQKISLLSPNEEYVDRIEPNRVEAEVIIFSQNLERDFSAIPISLLHSPGAEPLQLVPNPLEVTLKAEGREGLVASLTEAQFKAFVGPILPDDGPGGSYPVQVYAPPGVTIIEITPARISLIAPDKKDTPNE
ncbi:MAG: YbbR domain-containing protein [Kiritimatiellia bacterium]|jgi:YbbR domain-containing protein